MFYLIRKGRPLTNPDGSVRIFASAIEMGRLQRGDRPMLYRPGLVDQAAGPAGAPSRSDAA